MLHFSIDLGVCNIVSNIALPLRILRRHIFRSARKTTRNKNNNKICNAVVKTVGVYIEIFYSWETSIWKENGVGKVSEVGTTHQGAPRGAWCALVYRAHLDRLPVYFLISKIF